MKTRYDNRRKLRNKTEQYRYYFQKRGVNQINHYNTPVLTYPAFEELRNVSTTPHTWTSNDSFWKLAANNYGDAKMWWVIAYYNQKPTEFHVTLGEQILIPFPLDKIVALLTR